MVLAPAYPERPALSTAYPDVDTLGPAYPTGFRNLWSALFTFAASQYAKISDADFGAYSNTTVGMALNVKRTATAPAGTRGILSHWGTSFTTGSIALYWINDKLLLRIRDSAGNQHTIETTATFTSTVDTYKIQPEIDLTNATATDRLILRVDGVRQAVTDSGVPDSIVLFNSSAEFWVGRWGAFYADDAIDEFTLTSATIHPYSAFWDSAGVVIDRLGLTGIHSWLRFENNWLDTILEILWTPVNAPTFVSNP